MTSFNKDIWGHETRIRIIYDCLDDEVILDSQKKALQNFMAHWDVLESVVEQVKQQCSEDSNGMLSAPDIKDVYDYVQPNALFICREPDNTVALLCEYQFNPEHGLALVFHDEELTEIGPQDIVL